MTTVRELWDEAVKVGAEDYEVVFEEEGQLRFISRIEINLSDEEVVIH